MGSKPFKDQFYSNIIVYDERKRYYYLWQRMNKPLLDDEVRNMQLSLVDQMRRSIQGLSGDVAVPIAPYARSQDPVNPDSTILRYFKVTDNGIANSFKVIGGTGVDDPAVMFVKGFYVFLTGDIVYTDQNDSGDLIDPEFTETPIPDLNTPTSDRVDVVYVDFSFGEVSPTTGTNASEYTDTNLRNPIVGTETGNRLRAVFDIRVWEDYPNKKVDGSNRTTSLSTPYFQQNIFTGSDFLGSIDLSDPEANPIYKQHFLVPIAVLNRKSGIATITQDQIIDLLDLYDKRVLSTDELSYRTRHGGYGETAVYELGLTGFTARFPNAVIDESAFATGLNQGFGSEAFNTDSVTPRVVQNEGKFNMGSLLIGGETGSITYPISALTGAGQLHRGEIVTNELSTKSLYVGFDRGVTGAREYVDRLSVEMQGVTGTAVGLRIQNSTGLTGTLTQYIKGQAGITGNFVSVDYMGRMGINTVEPGWDGPNAIWNDADASNIVFDVDDSGKVRANLFVDGKLFVLGYVYGPNWQIPSEVSSQNPAIFGFTGLVNNFNGAVPTYGLGITGRASFYVRPGIAVIGDTGIPGYTGTFGFYECFDGNGERVFTIGELGDDFDRVVKTLYGTGARDLYYTSYSFKYLPSGYDELSNGDEVNIQGFDYEGNIVNSSYLFTGVNGGTGTVGLTGIYDLSQYIQADFLQTKVIVQIDPYDEAKPLVDRYGNEGKLIISDLENHSLLNITSLTVDRPLLDPIDIPLIKSKWYGTGNYGGDLLNLKFAKLDLGEAADAWLFNGDVFFNGNGYLNRVTFSPNVVFRDDVFVYGNFIADTTSFNGAKINSLTVNVSLKVDGTAAIHESLIVGYELDQAFNVFNTEVGKYNKLAVLVDGDIRANSFIALPEADVDSKQFGTLASRTRFYGSDLSLEINGTYDSTENPLGLHLIDGRSGVVIGGASSLSTVEVDYSDGRGTYGNILLNVRGQVNSEAILTKNITVSSTSELDTDYSLFVEGTSKISGTLYVDNLKYTGTNSNTSVEVTPRNIIVVSKPAGEIINNGNDPIIYAKDFSLTQKASLFNVSLGTDTTGYTDYYDAMMHTSTALWARDTLSYSNDDFTALGVSSISSSDYSMTADPLYARTYMDKIIVANIGTLTISWVGYSSNLYAGSVVQSYYLNSTLLKSSSGSNQTNWIAGGGRVSAENFVVNVLSSISGSNPMIPNLYNLSGSLGVYIPLSSWTTEVVTVGNYYSYLLFYEYENRVDTYNNIEFISQNNGGEKWRCALYPRINNQNYVISSTNSSERIFTGEWDLMVVLYPDGYASASNIVGSLKISDY